MGRGCRGRRWPCRSRAGAVHPLQSPGVSPGSGLGQPASVRLCFHSLIPGTRLSSPRAAWKEFNASLGRQKPCGDPGTARLPHGTAVPLVPGNKTPEILRHRAAISHGCVQFVGSEGAAPKISSWHLDHSRVSAAPTSLSSPRSRALLSPPSG